MQDYENEKQIIRKKYFNELGSLLSCPNGKGGRRLRGGVTGPQASTSSAHDNKFASEKQIAINFIQSTSTTLCDLNNEMILKIIAYLHFNLEDIAALYNVSKEVQKTLSSVAGPSSTSPDLVTLINAYINEGFKYLDAKSEWRRTNNKRITNVWQGDELHFEVKYSKDDSFNTKEITINNGKKITRILNSIKFRVEDDTIEINFGTNQINFIKSILRKLQRVEYVEGDSWASTFHYYCEPVENEWPGPGYCKILVIPDEKILQIQLIANDKIKLREALNDFTTNFINAMFGNNRTDFVITSSCKDVYSKYFEDTIIHKNIQSKFIDINNTLNLTNSKETNKDNSNSIFEAVKAETEAEEKEKKEKETLKILLSEMSPIMRDYVLKTPYIEALLGDSNNRISSEISVLLQMINTYILDNTKENSKKILLITHIAEYFLKEKERANIVVLKNHIINIIERGDPLLNPLVDTHVDPQVDPGDQDDQGGGAKKNKNAKITTKKQNVKKTDQKITYKGRKCTVYEGPNGGKYIKTGGKLVSMKSLGV